MDYYASIPEIIDLNDPDFVSTWLCGKAAMGWHPVMSYQAPNGKTVFVFRIEDEPQSDWQRLEDLRDGAIFETRAGVRAIKSGYRLPGGQPQCILLASGEYAHFPERGDILVRELFL